MSETKLQGVKRKDVAEDTAALREFQKTLVEGVDWWKEGVSTYWTQEAATRFHLTPVELPIEREVILCGSRSGKSQTAEGDRIAPELASEIYTLRVTKPAKNSYFVMCASPDEEGCSVPVRLLKKGSGAKLIKKTINAIRRDGQFQQIR